MDLRRIVCNKPQGLIVAFCAMALALAVAAIFVVKGQPDLYRATILPSFAGLPFPSCAMNDRGQVVSLVARVGGGFSVALWDREHGLQDLGIATDAPDCPVINNLGQIGGIMTGSDWSQTVFLWDPDSGLRRCAGGNMKNVHVCGIDGNGRVVGASEMDLEPPHACVWDRMGRMQDLNPLDAQTSVAGRVSGSGLVLGLSGEGAHGSPYLWDLADPNSVEWTPLPEQGAVYSDLNNAGYVLGQTVRPAEKPGQWPRKYAMLWHRRKKETWLFPLSGLNAKVLHVNDANQVVYSEPCSSILTKWLPRYYASRERMYLWDSTLGRVRLDKCFRLGRAERLMVLDFNNEGCIIGVVWSTSPTRIRIVLLEPIAGRWRK